MDGLSCHGADLGLDITLAVGDAGGGPRGGISGRHHGGPPGAPLRPWQGSRIAGYDRMPS
ncbi:hypothetical protein IBTHAUMO2_570006 [Nitrosopumilaceae archaeon]|nr:hypothetical protein IBTHAUMO2_570006 [Nitrosopumilaceae archaeon]